MLADALQSRRGLPGEEQHAHHPSSHHPSTSGVNSSSESSSSNNRSSSSALSSLPVAAELPQAMPFLVSPGAPTPTYQDHGAASQPQTSIESSFAPRDRRTPPLARSGSPWLCRVPHPADHDHTNTMWGGPQATKNRHRHMHADAGIVDEACDRSARMFVPCGNPREPAGAAHACHTHEQTTSARHTLWSPGPVSTSCASYSLECASGENKVSCTGPLERFHASHASARATVATGASPPRPCTPNPTAGYSGGSEQSCRSTKVPSQRICPTVQPVELPRQQPHRGRNSRHSANSHICYPSHSYWSADGDDSTRS